MDDAINDGHYFELLDRVHIASNYLEMAIGAHPVLKQHAELNSLYAQAFERLDSLYQAIGRLEQTWT